MKLFAHAGQIVTSSNLGRSAIWWPRGRTQASPRSACGAKICTILPLQHGKEWS